MAAFMLETCKLSRSINLMSGILKLIDVKLGCIKVDDNSEKKNRLFSKKTKH